jgi:hypothetical protein
VTGVEPSMVIRLAHKYDIHPLQVGTVYCMHACMQPLLVQLLSIVLHISVYLLEQCVYMFAESQTVAEIYMLRCKVRPRASFAHAL